MQPSDWYNISRQELTKRGGRGLFQYFPSLVHALKAVYPNVAWQPSRFADLGRTPHGFWENVDNHREFFEKAGKDLGVKEVLDRS